MTSGPRETGRRVAASIAMLLLLLMVVMMTMTMTTLKTHMHHAMKQLSPVKCGTLTSWQLT